MTRSNLHIAPPAPGAGGVSFITPIEFRDGEVRWLDQTVLPVREEFKSSRDYRRIIEAIKRLEIRGAPLIGVAAGYASVLAAQSAPAGDLFEAIGAVLAAIDEIASARPTAVNLRWAAERMAVVARETPAVGELVPRLLAEAMAIHRDDSNRCERIGAHGAELLSRLHKRPLTVLTHCNAGALATGGIGTALGVILTAWKQGNVSMVYMDETRPLLQGARLTAWELRKYGVPSTLIPDNTAAFLMQQGKIDCVITGADRIAANGDAANKIGTYNAAVLAKHHDIPMYIAAPKSTVDPFIRSGAEIPIEIRDPAEVTEGFGRRTAPEGVAVYSPAFDVTPAPLLTAVITEDGIHTPPYDFSGFR